MIDETTMRGIVAKLMFESLTPEDREKMLTSALASLVEPQRDQFGRGKSKLQETFDHAAAIAVGKLMREYFETPEVQARIKAFAVEAAEKAFAGGFSDKLAKKITDGLWKRIILIRLTPNVPERD